MRRIFRVAKSAVVLSLVFMMTVDTANACRLFSWLFAHRGACCASSAPAMGVSLSSCCDGSDSYAPPVMAAMPIVAAPVVESYPMASDVSYGGDVISSSSNCCCCNGGIVDGGYVDSGIVEGYSDAGYSDGGYVDGGIVEGYSDSGYVEGGEMIMDASPVDLAPSDTIVAPTPAFEDTNPVPTPEPADDTAAPADFGASDDAPADAPADDAFDNTDAGFGDAADTTEPVDNPLSNPADADAGDGDLFGGDAADDAAPADDGDLFDNAPADDAAPADGLFDNAPADDAADDDLFGGGATEETVPASVEDAPADATPDANSLDDLDDLFGQRRANGMRVWTDNTGSYETVGRLVVIAKTHVRLLKDNGRYSTVPLNRLSERDVEYVMAVAVRLTSPERLASR